MEKSILIIITICFIIGLVDYIRNNRWGIGKEFQLGLNNMGSLALAMIGILTVTPIISSCVLYIFSFVGGGNSFDISVVISSFIAVDMGAYNIAENIALSQELIIFSGIMISSIVGCTLSFTLPLALGIIDKKYVDELYKGIMIGLVVTPIGLICGGLLLGMKISTILISLIPILIILALLLMGIIVNKELVLKILSFIGKLILLIGAIGLGIQGINSILGINLFEQYIMPLSEVLTIVGKIAIFLAGGYVLIEIINRRCKRLIKKISNMLKISDESSSVLIGSLASAVIVFTTYSKLDEKGRVLTAAFSVGGAYVLGGQLGFVATECPEIIFIYIITKLLCGISAIVLVNIMYRVNRRIK